MAVTITMPQLGETVTEGTILAWVKQIGEYVAEDDILVEISTDKVDTEVPSPYAGVLTEILVPAGTTVEVGTPLAVLSGDDDQPEGAQRPAADSRQPEDTEQPAADGGQLEGSEQPTGGTLQEAAQASTQRRGVLSPVVRKLAAENDIDLAMVPGTGDGGRITRRDVEAFIVSRGAAPVPPAPVAPTPAVSPPPGPVPPAPAAPRPAATAQPGEVHEISRIRARIAQNMVQAKASAAHVWTSVEVDYERVAAARAKHGADFKAAEGFSLTYLPFIARATMDALAAYPVVHSLFDLEGGTHTFPRNVNLGIAIDLDQKGLIVANIPDADSMTLKGLARSIRSVATDARSNKLGPDDLTGFTFSITNPGPFGSFMSVPIIPPPNAAILSTDTATKKPVVIELPDGSDGIAIHHVGYLGLSWDHRVFDGSTAVLFLRRIKENLETWDWDQELS
jgi:2-oxoglutarate dehydrogenase E2 component (dihydrolipoamide succinyltransferase)